MSGRVIVAYYNPPTMERYKVGFSKKVSPLAVNLRELTIGVLIGFESYITALKSKL